MPTFTVENIDTVAAGEECVALRVLHDGRCEFDKFCKAQRVKGNGRHVATANALLDRLVRGQRLTPKQITWLRDDTTTGDCEHPGEFELRVKSLRFYGVFEDGCYYLMFTGDLKKGKGKKTTQTTAIKAFRRLVRDWIADGKNTTP